MVVVEGLGIPKGRFSKRGCLVYIVFSGPPKRKGKKKQKKKKALFVELVDVLFGFILIIMLCF